MTYVNTQSMKMCIIRGRMVTDAEIGGRLKVARLARKLSREAVAERIGKSVATVQHNENGERAVTVESLFDYCRVLRISSDWVLTGYGRMEAGAGDPEGAELLDLVRTLPDPDSRREVIDFARFKANQTKR